MRETLDFSARCQGIGQKQSELRTLMEREAAAGIDPDPEIDAFMKASSKLVHARLHSDGCTAAGSCMS